MYAINYTNRVGSNTVKEAESLLEAKNYCEELLEGYEPYDGDDDDRISWCKMEVYEILENGDIDEVYCTDLFWEKN